MTEFLALLDRYGPWVGIVLIVVIGLIPAIRDKLIPGIVEIFRAREEFQRKVELDRLESSKRTDNNIQMLASAMTTMAAQVTSILETQNTILETLQEGMAAMRESVARREGYERGKQEHKKGDTGPLSDDKK